MSSNDPFDQDKSTKLEMVLVCKPIESAGDQECKKIATRVERKFELLIKAQNKKTTISK